MFLTVFVHSQNVGDTLETAFSFLRDTEAMLNSTKFAVPLNASLYDPDTVSKLEKGGYNISTLLATINAAIPSQFPNDIAFPFRVALLTDMDVIASGLRVRHRSYVADGMQDSLTWFIQGINIIVQDNSIASNEITALLDIGFNRTANVSLADLNKQRFISVAMGAMTEYGTPASWFTAGGGLVIVLLACMELLDHWRVVMLLFSRNCEQTVPPRKEPEEGDAHELHQRATCFCLQIAGKLVCGFLLISLTSLENHFGRVELDAFYRFHGSNVWKLAIQSWL